MLPASPPDLLLLSILSPTTEEGQLPSILQQVKDWELLIRSAQHHQLLPLLHQRIAKAGLLQEIPAGPRKMLEFLSLQSRLRNLRLIAYWKDILLLFEQNHLPSITLKGPALIELLYHDPGLRPMTDLDFLIPAENANRAFDLLIQSGAKEVPVFQTRFIEQQLHHLPPLDYKGVCIEFHSFLGDLPEDPLIPENELWKQAEIITGEGLSFHSLCKQQLAKYLQYHWEHHVQEQNEKWIWLYDLALFKMHFPEWLKGMFEQPPDLEKWYLQSVKLASENKAVPKIFLLPFRKQILYVLGLFFPRPAHMRFRYGAWWLPAYLWNPLRVLIKSLFN